MKTLSQWFEEYAESHRHPTNKLLHWICVPLITFSVLGMSYALSPWLAAAVTAAALYFYLRLSMRLAVGMLVCTLLMLGIVALLPRPFIISLAVFVIAWLGQFYGHLVEGRKPSFFQDLQFLLIGPAWLLQTALARWQLRL